MGGTGLQTLEQEIPFFFFLNKNVQQKVTTCYVPLKNSSSAVASAS